MTCNVTRDSNHLTVQSDLSLRLPERVLTNTLVSPVIPRIDLGDGQAGVEAVTLELLLGLVAVAADDHHVLEHTEGDRLDMNDIHYRGPALFGISRRDLG